jgi:hypothetical protein
MLGPQGYNAAGRAALDAARVRGWPTITSQGAQP